MRIVIVRGSHGDVRVFNDMLAVPGAAEAELWLHAGDFAPDADDLELLSGRRVVRVLGNCDLFVDGVYDETAMLAEAARTAGADIAVYGHTHIALVEHGDVTVLNPGSIARPRDEQRGSFMLVDLNAGENPQVNLIRI